MANPTFSHDFIGEFIPENTPCCLHHHLTAPFNRPNQQPGDIDLLFYPLHDPSQAIAIECKRIKMVSYPDGRSRVNRTGEIDKGIEQAGAYHALGFHPTYILVMLLDDGRELTTPTPCSDILPVSPSTACSISGGARRDTRTLV